MAEKHGYTGDGWSPDEDHVFYYSDQGARGDQSFRAGNRAIRDHADDGRALHLFKLAEKRNKGGNLHEYLDEFEVDREEPYRFQPAPDEDGNLRKIIVFKLRMIGGIRQPVKVNGAELVAAEINVSLRNEVTPSLTVEAVRREAIAMAMLEQVLADRGHVTKRWKIPIEQIDGSPASLFTDTFDETEGVLWEVKASAGRASVRMAIGQLADYLRFLPEGISAGIVLPMKPARDLIALIKSQSLRLLVVGGDGLVEL